MLKTPLVSDLKAAIDKVEARPLSNRNDARLMITVVIQRLALVLWALQLIVNGIRLGVASEGSCGFVLCVCVCVCVCGSLLEISCNLPPF